MDPNKIRRIKEAVGVGNVVANELLTLAGEDDQLAINQSVISPGLDQSKANILNERLRRIEDAVRDLRKDGQE